MKRLTSAAIALTGVFLICWTAHFGRTDENIVAPTDVKVEVAPSDVFLLALDVAPDGKQIATGGDALRVFDSATGKLTFRAAAPQLIRCVQFSPIDSNLVATGGDDGVVRIWDIEAKTAVREIDQKTKRIANLSYSLDGKLLAIVQNVLAAGAATGKLVVRHADSEKIAYAKEFPGVSLQAVAFARDGGRIAITKEYDDETRASTVEVLSVDSFETSKNVAFFPGFGLGVTFTADGSGLIIAGGDCAPLETGGCHVHGRIWIADLASNEAAKQVETDRSDYFRRICLSPAGARFVTAASTTRDVVDATGNLNGTQGMAEVQLRDAQTGKLIWKQDAGNYGQMGVGLFPDGKRAAVSVQGRPGNQIHIVKLDGGPTVSFTVTE